MANLADLGIGVFAEDDVSMPQGRRLRRALDSGVVAADRLVRAHMALHAATDAIREAAEAMRERDNDG